MIDKSDEDDYSCALVEDESVKTTAKLIVEGEGKGYSKSKGTPDH